MKKLILAMAIVSYLLMGCAKIAGQGKMEEFGRTMDSYETAMQLSDFHAACQNVDSTVMGRDECLQRYKNLKVVRYNVLAVNISDDKSEVKLAVEVQYFFLDRYVVKKIQFDQTWQYKEALKRWYLKTGPPVFN